MVKDKEDKFVPMQENYHQEKIVVFKSFKFFSQISKNILD
jgi:hypothetical protein